MTNPLDRDGWTPLNRELTHISYCHGGQLTLDVAVCSTALAPRAVWSLGQDLGSDLLLMLLEVKGSSRGTKARPKSKRSFPRADWLAFQEECKAAFMEADPEHTP